MSVSITSFGAVADGTTDNHDAIQAALDYAQAHGQSVLIPRGTFAYSGTLTANGITVAGTGDGSVLKALDPNQESLILTGTGGALHDFQMQGNNSAGRLTTFESGMIWVHDATGYTIRDVHINGSASVGIVSEHSSSGSVLNNTIENTLADSIHNVNGSHHVTIQGNRIMRSGDDGISVVSYGDLPIVHDILIQGNTVLDNVWGRGLTVVGGRAVTIASNHVEGGSAGAAGIYVAAESEYGTLGVSDVTVRDNTLIDAGGVFSGHGAITVYNSQAGSAVITGVILDHNQIVAPRADGVLFVGGGRIQTSVTANTVYGIGHTLIQIAAADTAVTQSGNRLRAEADFVTPLVPAGGGFGSGRGTPVYLPSWISDASHPASGLASTFLAATSTAASLVGTAGNDQIRGIAGQADVQGLAGGAGDDVYVADLAGDRIIESAGAGIDTVVSSASTFQLAANVENLVIVATSAAAGIGNDSNNILIGNDLANRLDGGRGHDLLYGGAGGDSMIGGAGNDTYYVDNAADRAAEAANAGTDSVFAAVSYTLAANVERLTLTGTADIAAIGNNNANNVLVGNAGHNRLDGRAGADIMAGGGGDDLYYVDDANDAVKEATNAGADRVFASASFILPANVERLYLTGAAALDAGGNAMDNVLVGNAAANVLDGGRGLDILSGGDGGDRFRYSRASDGGDIIRDFSTSQGDKIAFVSANFGNLSPGALSPTLLRASSTGAATSTAQRFLFNTTTGVLTYDANGSGQGGAVTIATLNVRSLSAADIAIVAS
ncbi:MAG TPA: right-handed parallel beta-helix repeat-containing protein [Magnetospirillum sp.]|nr:right-handed parallel beta-helix repeat-containing protein [Magnetospirillum sp.]